MSTDDRQEHLAENQYIDYENHDVGRMSVDLVEERDPEVATILSISDNPSLPTFLHGSRAPPGRLNPGPFNVKEHVLIALMANCATSTAYAVDITVIQKVYYHQDFGFIANLFLNLTTQMSGYGMAGTLRRYFVYPAAMIWPANLASVPCPTLFIRMRSWLPATGPDTSLLGQIGGTGAALGLGVISLDWNNIS
ncbi:hypothetical protein BGZ83_000185 [Gryganskiella cystojenkinii]|nr:hypothetical protein BGZ83_000185 [Gryganskiella cystojenkinii]